jgi:hypothetical protein
MGLIRLGMASRNAGVRAHTLLVDAAGPLPGLLDIRSGIIPTDPDEVPSGVLLARLLFPLPAFALPFGGEATLASPILPVTILADGEAAWFRATDGNGTVAWDGPIGLIGSGKPVELHSLTLVQGAPISVAMVRYYQLAS